MDHNYLRSEYAGGTVKANDKMEEIMNAALYLFSTKGYLKTSMTEIADSVNLTKGGIYHYLSKKEDALIMIHERMTNAFVTAFRESSSAAGNPKEKLASWIRVHAMLVKDYQPHIKIFFTELDYLKNSKYYKGITEKRDEIFNLLYETIKEGRRQKLFREDIHPRILTFLIMGMMNWFYQWYRPDGPRSIEKIIEDVQNLVFEGVSSHRS
jgi:AcrR family transcriptional regulator